MRIAPLSIATVLLVGGCIEAIESEGDEIALSDEFASQLRGVYFANGLGVQVLGLYPDTDPDNNVTGTFRMAFATDGDRVESNAYVGTYRLYHYRGSHRIRLNDAEGEVIARHEVEIMDGGKTLRIDGKDLPQLIKRNEMHCAAIGVDDFSFFQDSLSVWGNPQVIVEGWPFIRKVRIGDSNFGDNNTVIAGSTDGRQVRIRVEFRDGGKTFEIQQAGDLMEIGELVDGDGKRIAQLACEPPSW